MGFWYRHCHISAGREGRRAGIETGREGRRTGIGTGREGRRVGIGTGHIAGLVLGMVLTVRTSQFQVSGNK